MDIVEIFEPNQDILKSKGYNPLCIDFLKMPIPTEVQDKYNVVMMNPPFSVKSDKKAYMTHINHALKLLKPFGELVAIIPTGWVTSDDKRSEAFRNLLSEKGTLETTVLKKGTFKDAGTNVETVIISFVNNNWRENTYSGFDTFYEWDFTMSAFNDYDNVKRLEDKFTIPRLSKRDPKVYKESIGINVVEEYVNYIITNEAKNYHFINTELKDKYIARTIYEIEEGYGVNVITNKPEPVKTSEVKEPKKATISKKNVSSQLTMDFGSEAVA